MAEVFFFIAAIGAVGEEGGAVNTYGDVARLPVDEIIPVADTVKIRPDPE